MNRTRAVDDPGPLRWLQWLFFALLVRPLVWLVLGTNLKGADNLPARGPAIIAANHNSHLDTLVLMALYPLRELHRVRPLAANDYFLSNPLLAWFARRVVGIVPLPRVAGSGPRDPLAGAEQALRRGDIVLLFPEGSRGEPEVPTQPKAGVAHLLRRVPAAPLVPVHLGGLGKVLPRGEGLLVPFICDIRVEPVITLQGATGPVMQALRESLDLQAADWSER